MYLCSILTPQASVSRSAQLGPLPADTHTCRQSTIAITQQYVASASIASQRVLVCLQATVGAGLPVIATLKHLVDTGDRILKVEGIFSGTLSYIFNMFSQDRPFSDIVTEAKSLGYTEPDPRDDLAGMDVARKVTILAR